MDPNSEPRTPPARGKSGESTDVAPDSPSKEGYLTRKLDEFVESVQALGKKFPLFSSPESYKNHLPSRKLDTAHVKLHECPNLSFQRSMHM